MGISLAPEHLKCYKNIALLLMKYGRSDLVKHMGLDEALGEDVASHAGQGASKAVELARDLEAMGPTFVKLGQLLSSRADFLPLEYVEALARLQDSVAPFPSQEAEQIVASELGARISRAFAQFDPVPIAAASLGQVHRAAMRDGRPVVVKVQRPGIRRHVVEDLDAIQDVAAFLDKHTEFGARYEFEKMVQEFRKTILRELNYRQEARNLVLLGENLRAFDRIVVPCPIDDYTTSRVLTMDYIRGKKITALGPLARIELDGAELAEQLFHAYLQQILVDGFFHADPHPGNVFLTDDRRIALLDLGMTATVAPAMQDKLLQLLLAVSEGDSDEALDIAIAIGEVRAHFDKPAFSRHVTDLVSRQKGARMGDLEVGRLMLEFSQASAACGLRLPPELTMLAKALLNLDHVGRTLDPAFDPNASIRRNASSMLRHRLLKSLSPGNMFSGLIELKNFIAKLPEKINRIVDTLANNELTLKVDAIDDKKLIQGLQKIANRITLGLILAALIIGAALLMRVETTFRIFGYPGLAILLFLAAAAGGVALIVQIIWHDEKPGKDSPR